MMDDQLVGGIIQFSFTIKHPEDEKARLPSPQSMFGAENVFANDLDSGWSNVNSESTCG